VEDGLNSRAGMNNYCNEILISYKKCNRSIAVKDIVPVGKCRVEQPDIYDVSGMIKTGVTERKLY